MARIFSLLILMIFAVNAGFSVPHHDLHIKFTKKYENPHKKNNVGKESEADELINESETEESSENSKKNHFPLLASSIPSSYTIERYYSIIATPLASHLDFILADSEQYLRLRKLLI